MPRVLAAGWGCAPGRTRGLLLSFLVRVHLPWLSLWLVPLDPHPCLPSSLVVVSTHITEATLFVAQCMSSTAITVSQPRIVTMYMAKWINQTRSSAFAQSASLSPVKTLVLAVLPWYLLCVPVWISWHLLRAFTLVGYHLDASCLVMMLFVLGHGPRVQSASVSPDEPIVQSVRVAALLLSVLVSGRCMDNVDSKNNTLHLQKHHDKAARCTWPTSPPSPVSTGTATDKGGRLSHSLTPAACKKWPRAPATVSYPHSAGSIGS